MNINWDERFTETIPNVIQNINAALQDRLTAELYNFPTSTFTSKSKNYYNDHVPEIPVRYAAKSILELAGMMWKVEHATDEVYWIEGTMWAYRDDYKDEYATMCMVAGTFPTRVKKIAKRRYGIKLNDKFIAEFGEFSKRGLLGEGTTTVHVRLTNCIDWRSGTFGDDGSCFWGDRSAAKDMIVNAGGGACQHFSDDSYDYKHGASRCWIIPKYKGFVIFNAYGELNLNQFATILSKHFGFTYDKVSLSNNGDSSGTLYINSNGYYIRPETAQSRTYIDFELDDGTRTQCADCGEYHNEDNMTDVGGSYDYHYVCESCFDNYVSCEWCSTYFYNDSDYIIYHEGSSSYYCRACAERLDIHECHDCGTWHKNCTDIGENTTTWICESCLDNYAYCDDCNTWVKYDESESDDHGTYCKSCYKEHHLTECCVCHALHPNDEIVWHNNHDYCEDCFDLTRCEVCQRNGVIDITERRFQINGEEVCEECYQAFARDQQGITQIEIPF